MKHFLSLLVMAFVFVLSPAGAQTIFDFSDEAVILRLKEDIYTLASEEMEGREAGTEGERKAAAYIKLRMQEIGLEPMFDGSYYQEFPFPGEWFWGDDNYFTYMDHTFEHGVDYYVLPGASSGQVSASFAHVGYGLTALEGIEGFEDYCDYALHGDIAGKFFIMEFYLPEALDTLADRRMFQLLFSKVEAARENGAAGIVFVNTRSERDDPPIDLRMSRRGFDIPILFAKDNVLHALMTDQSGALDVSVDIFREDLTGLNVAGYFDNEADATVVIGGHYDHVGYGGRGSGSPGVHAIHPGADDNASGTAGVLEAARYVSHASLNNYNYIFIAFSAEEKGLIGSRYFTDSDVYDMEKINYMFNLDMIGRMEDNTLTLIGTGSSPSWDDLIASHAPDHFTIRKNPGGRGGSDHTSFYVKDIPVIFFFTGVHEDYHRPGDTADKINYEHAAEIVRFSLDMVTSLEHMERLAFTPAPTGQPGRAPERTVALGLMPDHGFDGEGLRVMAVSDNQPAQRAGMENGDVIIRINEMPVREIQSYMEALSALRRGSTARVVVIRDDEEHTLDVNL